MLGLALHHGFKSRMVVCAEACVHHLADSIVIQKQCESNASIPGLTFVCAKAVHVFQVLHHCQAFRL